jgi:hypothetical protein
MSEPAAQNSLLGVHRESSSEAVSPESPHIASNRLASLLKQSYLVAAPIE